MLGVCDVIIRLLLLEYRGGQNKPSTIEEAEPNEGVVSVWRGGGVMGGVIRALLTSISWRNKQTCQTLLIWPTQTLYYQL